MSIIVFILLQLAASCLSSGVVEINLVNFSNKEGKRRDGQCCDPVDSVWSWRWWFANSDDDKCEECNHIFSFCLGNNTEFSSMLSCEYGRVRSTQITQNEITFGRNVGGIENPLQFPFKSWPGVIKLKLDILDEDSPGSFDFIDHYDYQYNPRELKKHFDAPVKKLHLVGSMTEINLEMRVYCDLSYFGSDCTKYCTARDDHLGHYRCNPVTGDKICLFGWIGPDCQTNFNDCNGNRCHNGATCIDQIGYYTCKCPPGRTGAFCDGEINECASSPCQNGATCRDILNGFSCECLQNWTGIFCETTFVPCVANLCVHGYCSMEDGKDVCVCNDGFRGELCDKSVTTCADKPCTHMIWCEDLSEGYRCTCQDDYTGRNCEIKISACDSEPCLNNGACTDLVDYYMCSCPDGFYGDRCEFKINECESSPCQHDGFCVDLHLGYKCVCTNITTGNNCEQYIDKCYTKPCQNGGTCISEGDGYRCICPPFTDSPHCEIFLKVDPCASSPCKNDAICIPTEDEHFTCQCTTGYRGTMCDTKIDVCESLTCLNGGTCMSDTYSCLCEEGYTGPVCEEDIDECQDLPCEHGGICINKIGDFDCVCQDGFTGPLCEDIIDISTPFESTQSEKVHTRSSLGSSQVFETAEKDFPTTITTSQEDSSSFQVEESWTTETNAFITKKQISHRAKTLMTQL